MSKFNWVLSTILLTTMAVVSGSIGLTQPTRTQTEASNNWQELLQNALNPQSTEDNQPPKPPGAATARGTFCGISPQSLALDIETWSDRPLFVWQGEIGKIEVRSGNFENVLWQQTVAAADNQAAYAGEALQPGQIYIWAIFNRQNNLMLTVPFKVMEAQERERVQLELQSLEQDLKGNGAAAEDIALQRANYFAQQQLWSDALQEVYSVENPSPALQQMRQDLAKQLCEGGS